MNWTEEKSRQSSHIVHHICGQCSRSVEMNSLSNNLLSLVVRMPKMCSAVINARRGDDDQRYDQLSC